MTKHRWVWIPSLAVMAAVAAGMFSGLPALLLVAAGAVLTGVIALIWTSLSSLSGTDDLTFEEALSLAAPTVEEEQKRAVLRALKDLEYELRVGKISRADFDEVSARYRAEARRLIALSDATLDERRQAAETRLQRFLEKVESSTGETPAPSAAASEKHGVEPSATSAQEQAGEKVKSP